MDFNKFLELKNGNKTMPLHPDHKRDVEACLAVQIHTSGARPSFTTPSGVYIEPESYHKKYDDFFKYRLLNRHPNETPSMYQWRLSIFSPVAKEPYNKFENSFIGSVLNRNSFSISADELTMQALENKELKLAEIFTFIVNNPVGYIGTILEAKEHSKSEYNVPEIVCISCEDIIMYDYHSIAFSYEGHIYFIDEKEQVTITKNGETYVNPHNIGKMTIDREVNSFLQPYQNWSDLLCRNLSDDEAMVKNYSYPFVQIVENDCLPCAGSGRIADPNFNQNDYDPNNPNAGQINCTACNGKGTTSHNPGEFLTISEETLARNGGTMQDLAKFITPDVGIPEYHLKRWKEFYHLCESSLHIKSVIEGVQSGDAKKEDRKDQYYFYQSISNYLFNIVRKNLMQISRIVNLNKSSSEVYVSEPKQFDIMSDSDLLNDFSSLQAKTDDSQTLSELNYMINSKLYKDDKVQLKINEVMYLVDPLFGIAGNALRAKLLSGVYTDKDKVIHEKGYLVLKSMAKEMMPEIFVSKNTDELISVFNDKLELLMPNTIYSEMSGGVNSGGLKDSVGGLTGMIEIAKAVASGLYDLDAAVALVSDRFGISEEEARKQLGTPQRITSEAQANKVATLT